MSTALDITVPADLEDEALAAIAAARPEEAGSQNAKSQPDQPEPQRRKNYWEALVLALLFGPLGLLYTAPFATVFKIWLIGTLAIAALAPLNFDFFLGLAYLANLVLALVLVLRHNLSLRRVDGNAA